jgi:3-hydroxyisobutyrate dehydrogenase-like beta-hydroxyacid dehydrogenase
MSLALELAEKVRSNVHFAEESMKYYLDLEKEGHGRKDFGYVFQYINREQKSKSD